jgi:hypothetical protein
LFLVVIIMVALLVWFKPENLTFDKFAHLVNSGKASFGSNKNTIKSDKRFVKPTNSNL